MSVRTELSDGILLVMMDRPEARNALNREMGMALTEAWQAFQADPNQRVAILTGVGDKAFCAGADLKEMRSVYGSMTPLERRERGERMPGLGGLTRNFDAGKPIIAAINGPCLAGGLELALACDMRIAADHAVFGLPEVKRGIIPGAGGTQRLPRAIPVGIAMEMLATGEPIDAERAYSVGLINRVVPLDGLLEAAFALAKTIARNAPLAVQAARAAALKGMHLPLDDGLRLEQFYAEPCRHSEDAQEGIKAFAEKREAIFRGR